MEGIREPVHRWITLSTAEKHLLDSPYVQRLRRLSQLGVASLVFPGGVHNRFLHSLGVMHLAGKYAETVGANVQVCRVAGLLHDIGHGPFSHTWDKMVYSHIYKEQKGHDAQRFELLLNDDLSARIEGCGVTIMEVHNAWLNEPCKSIIQGIMGADRIDYMLRDSYYTGTSHFGTVAVDRIIHNSYIEDGKLLYREKVNDEISRALEGREYMYKNVYQHHTVNAADNLLCSLIQRAIDIDIPLIEYTENPELFQELDEYWLIGHFRLSKDEKIRTMCKKLLNRDIKE